MRKIIILLLLMPLLVFSVSGEEFTAPAPPDSVADLVPAQTESFGKDLWKVFLSALEAAQPEMVGSAKACLGIVGILLLVSILGQIPGQNPWVLEFGAGIGIAVLLLGRSGSMIRLASETVEELNAYGKLMLPVLTAALSAQGGITSAAALYAGTVALDAVLSSLICNILVPAVYVYLALSIAQAVTNNETLGRLSGLIKWFGSWSLKTLLYIFTGYLGITGVVSTTADAATLKATKLSIAGVVPVVGGILSDASEAVLLGAGVVKSSIGIYGLLVTGALWVGPFLRIGVLYLLLKVSAGICAGFSLKGPGKLVQCFGNAMGLLLAMIGTMSMLQLISTVCFMKGVG